MSPNNLERKIHRSITYPPSCQTHKRSVLRKCLMNFSSYNYFRKKLHLTYLTVFWTRLCRYTWRKFPMYCAIPAHGIRISNRPYLSIHCKAKNWFLILKTWGYCMRVRVVIRSTFKAKNDVQLEDFFPIIRL